MVMDNVKLKQQIISTVWIYYKNVFDSVPHDWIIEILKIHKVDPITTKFIRKTIENCRALLYLNHQNCQIKTDFFSVWLASFRDSPSGLLFILSLLPLSWLLSTSNLGYRINHQYDIISHLFFMEDLKLFPVNDNQLASIIKIVNKFSDDIRMSFGIDKFQRWKIAQIENIQLDNGEELKSLEISQQYKILRIWKKSDHRQSNQIITHKRIF